MRSETYNIVKTEVDSHSVILTLQNGVQLSVSSNDGYFSFHFARVDLPLRWGESGGQIMFSSNNRMSCIYQPAGFGQEEKNDRV